MVAFFALRWPTWTIPHVEPLSAGSAAALGGWLWLGAGSGQPGAVGGLVQCREPDGPGPTAAPPGSARQRARAVGDNDHCGHLDGGAVAGSDGRLPPPATPSRRRRPGSAPCVQAGQAVTICALHASAACADVFAFV